MLATPDRSLPTSYDMTAKTITVVIGAVLLVSIVATQSIITGVMAALMFLLAYAYSPRRYTILDPSIVVHRVIGNLSIPLDTIREARVARRDDFCGGIRLWGNGGLTTRGECP